jgi:hypothetical protein
VIHDRTRSAPSLAPLLLLALPVLACSGGASLDADGGSVAVKVAVSDARTHALDAAAPHVDALASGAHRSDALPTDAREAHPETGSRTADSAMDAASDGAASTKYPAFAPDVPQIINNGGPVLAHPVIVTVTWSIDPNASVFEGFGDGLGATEYWADTVGEYGVGPATSGPGNHVSITTPAPTRMSDIDVVNLITSGLAGQDAGVDPDAAPGSAWPAPTPDTMYVVYLPPGTSLTFQGEDVCQMYGGYHDSLTFGSANVAYAALPQCEGGTGTVTLAASHEIGEGSADPYPAVTPAYNGFDQAHYAWTVFQESQVEVADACEFYVSSAFTDTDAGFAYELQRLWSNEKAAAGHNPCQPADTPVYYNTTLIAPEAITVDTHATGGPSNYQVTGVHVLPGETKTVPVGFISDAPTGGPWTLIAHDGNPVGPAITDNGDVTLSLDTSSGQNGDIAHLTITVNAAGGTNSELIVLESRLGVGASHWLPILIGSQ